MAALAPALRSTWVPAWLVLGLGLACSSGAPLSAPGVVRVEEVPPGTDLFVDARRVGPASVGTELPVTAGTHVLEARSGDTVVAHAVLDVAPGMTLPLRLVADAAGVGTTLAPSSGASSAAVPPAPAAPGTEPIAPAGSAAAPLGPPPEEGAPLAPAERTAAEVSAVIARHRGSLNRCFEQSLRASPEAGSARFDVALSISAEGAVTSVEVARSVGGTAELGTCIERAVRTWTFPPASAAGTVEFPVVFSAG